MKPSFAEIIENDKANFKKKFEKKFPQWQGKNIVIPSSLSFEQSSSNQTASYKAELASKFTKNNIICDITGGLGVDSFAFAALFNKVHYFERQTELVKAVQTNANILNINNIEFHNEEISEKSDIPTCDLIYADPARRSESGKKVFLLEDCSPDIINLLPKLYLSSSKIMLKLSPMADIAMVANRLGEQVTEIHIVSLNSEVKELLVLLDKEHRANYKIKVVELSNNTYFEFSGENELNSQLIIADKILENQILIEPCPGLLKASCHKLICTHFNISKLDVNTNLYLSDTIIDTKLVKQFKIVQIFSFKQVKEIKKLYPSAEVSAKNIFMKSEELRKRLNIAQSSDYHIFGAKTKEGNLIIVTQPLL